MSDTIFVVRKVRDFTQVPNSLLNDSDLSFTAKGVLCYLLSKPDGWKLRVSDIGKHGTEGERAIRTALNELRDAGYAEYTAPKTVGESGKWKVSENPIFSRRCCFSHGGGSNGENDPLSNTECSNTDNNNTRQSPISSVGVGNSWRQKTPTREEYEEFCNENCPDILNFRDFDSIVWTNILWNWQAYIYRLSEEVDDCKHRR